jgi:hypothetical protein
LRYEARNCRACGEHRNSLAPALDAFPPDYFNSACKEWAGVLNLS